MSKEKVIETALGEVGKTENPPGSNMTEYGERYGWNGVPWCVQFLWDCFNRGGERAAFFGGAKTASCGTLMQWYKEQGQLVPIEEATGGDIGFFAFNGGKVPEHCGLITEGRTDYVLTVEGNTTASSGSGNESNGGCVAEKLRGSRYLVGVARPKYKEETVLADKKPDYAGHWAIASIIKAMDKGVMNGYPDGSFRPNDTPTRAELAVILDRLGLLD